MIDQEGVCVVFILLPVGLHSGLSSSSLLHMHAYAQSCPSPALSRGALPS